MNVPIINGKSFNRSSLMKYLAFLCLIKYKLSMMIKDKPMIVNIGLDMVKSRIEIKNNQYFFFINPKMAKTKVNMNNASAYGK